MTEEEIRKAYPNAAEAVLLHEESVVTDWHWQRLRARSVPPEKVLDALQRTADVTLSLIPEGPLTECREQMDHPDFLRWIRAKLGAT